jgi:transcription termination factor Rho
MSVLDRAALEDSPLADLHAIASELSIDSYRRLRRAELIDRILERQSGEPAAADASEAPEAAGVADVAGGADVAGEAEDEAEAAEPEVEEGDEEERQPSRRRRGRRGGRGRTGTRERGEEREADDKAQDEEETEAEEEEEAQAEPAREAEEAVEGVVELLPNGSGFLRVSPPDPSDDDVYVSAAQVKRCELLSGDRVAGPRRPPRRSERFASLVRIDTINGSPAAELASGARFDDLPAAFPDERFRLGSEDPTIKAIEWLTPLGRGSRVTIAGAARAGKSDALRRLAAVLAEHEDVQLLVVLAGVRPEEIPEWNVGPVTPTAALSFAASQDAQDQAVELVVDQARRIAARGTHAIVLIDTLSGLHPNSARKALAAARNIVDGGSLTVIATAAAPIGGETTVIALDAELASAGRFPALDLAASGTIRPELLVGDAGAEAIMAARREAVEG